MPILIIILVFVLALFGYIFYAYNRLAQLRNVCETEWAQVDVYLKKRADLIPNLIEVVKGYAKHEKEVLEGVSRARSDAMAASRSESGKETSLSSHVKSVFALREHYPDLKANQDFLQLQKELYNLEAEIIEHRRAYNDVAKAHNDFVLKFPGNLIASMTGFALVPLFEFEGTREAPKLNMTPGEESVSFDGQT
jgi:LemA protein